MSLALAIPVKDDHAALHRLVQHAVGMGIFSQIVVVDDGSQVPVALPWAKDILHLRRNDTSRGPGVARNMALEHVTATHLIYVDSDDRLTDDFPALWADLRTEAFDLCLFRHHDTRQEQAGRWGQLPQDEALWRRAGLTEARPQVVGPAARRCLAETANYPWNKVYRVAFLRAARVSCAETLVHEDVQLHWLALLEAERVCASTRVGIVHRVVPGGNRLTNLRTASRFQVFAVCAHVVQRLLERRSERDLVTPFLRFVVGLFDWIHVALDPALLPEFQAQLAQFLQTSVPPDLYAELVETDPVLALRLGAHMAASERRAA